MIGSRFRHHAHMPRYRRYFAPQQTVFLTIATAGRSPWLRSDINKRRVLEALRKTRKIHPFRHIAHVLLHDHIHLLVAPTGPVRIPATVACFKRAVTAVTMAPKPLWQRRYYDHIIRDDDDFRRHLDYIHYNPVKHGLAEHADEWPWSSLAQWQARGLYPPHWDVIAADTSPPP